MICVLQGFLAAAEAAIRVRNELEKENHKGLEDSKGSDLDLVEELEQEKEVRPSRSARERTRGRGGGGEGGKGKTETSNAQVKTKGTGGAKSSVEKINQETKVRISGGKVGEVVVESGKGEGGEEGAGSRKRIGTRPVMQKAKKKRTN